MGASVVCPSRREPSPIAHGGTVWEGAPDSGFFSGVWSVWSAVTTPVRSGRVADWMDGRGLLGGALHGRVSSSGSWRKWDVEDLLVVNLMVAVGGLVVLLVLGLLVPLEVWRSGWWLSGGLFGGVVLCLLDAAVSLRLLGRGGSVD